MKILSHEAIEALAITPRMAVDWVRESFICKESAVLPHKISLPFKEGHFMNTMPCMLPHEGVFGCKIVTRYPGRKPSVDGEMLLYDYASGELLALLDAFWITNARTGAVAALAVETLAAPGLEHIGMMGLGNTARSTLACLHAIYPERRMNINLLAYKDQAEKFAEWGSQFSNFRFNIISSAPELVESSEAVISCITYTDGVVAPDECYRPGCLVVPVHTRGFQNCDLFFDKVYADDTEHVRQFRYFDRFRRFAELSDVLLGRKEGRCSAGERILSYNIGLAMHDVLYASRIYQRARGEGISLTKSSAAFCF